MNNIKISVVIPSFNRANLLHYVFDSMQNQTYDKEKFEVIFVDNGSTDNTKKTVYEFISKYAELNIRYFYEEKLGVSHARNRGIEESNAEIIAFIDDDARANQDWLEIIDKTFLDYPDIKALGGALYPHYLHPKPKWFDDRYVTYLWGEDIRSFGFNESPYGSNMVVKKVVFNEIGGFNPNYGFIGRQLITGEEPEFFKRLNLNFTPNYSSLYIPNMIVYHLVGKNKLNMYYRLKRGFISGKTARQIERRFPKIKSSTSLSIKLDSECKIVVKILLLLCFWNYSSISNWFYEIAKKVCYFSGRFVGNFIK